MSRKNGTEHVVVVRDSGRWLCSHCGEERDPPKTPLPLSAFLAKLQGFLLLHRDCPDPRKAQP